MSNYFKRCVPAHVWDKNLIYDLSKRPHHYYSQAFLSVLDVVTCLQVPGLRDSVRQNFKGLSTVSKPYECIRASFDPAVYGPDLLLVEEDKQYLETLLISLADDLKRLTVDVSLFYAPGSRTVNTRVINALARSSIRELSIYLVDDVLFPLGDVLRGCTNLEQLTVGSYDLNYNIKQLALGGGYLNEVHLAAISTCASHVHVLGIGHLRMNSDLSDFWRNFKKLEKLSIAIHPGTTTPHRDHVFSTIDESCSRIHALDVGLIPECKFLSVVELSERIAISLKELQLSIQELPVNEMTNGLSRIRLACPNVRVKLTSMPNRLVPALNALGPAIVESAQPTESIFISIPEGLGAAAAGCLNLKSVTLSLLESMAPVFLDAMLGGPVGRNLEELRLSFITPYGVESLASAHSPALQTIAQHTGNLIRFVLDDAVPNVSLRDVAEKNRGLRGLVVNVYGSTNNIVKGDTRTVEEWATSIVADFLELCQVLDDIVIEDSSPYVQVIPRNHRIKKLEELCSQQGKRKVAVRVGHEFYEK